MGKRKRIQYHPAFCAATELELRENKDQLSYHKEYAVYMRAKQVDLVIVKEVANATICSGLGAIFKKYNLFEYKHPNQTLDINTYHKVLAYATLMLEHKRQTEECSMEDFSISFIRKRRPQKLLEQLKKFGFTITEFQPGIYHVTRELHIAMQFIVTSRLGGKYKWITRLTSKLDKTDMDQLYHSARGLSNQEDRSNAETVIELAVHLNKDKDWMKEEKIMGAYREIFKEDFKEIFKEDFKEMFKEDFKEMFEEMFEEKTEELNQQLKNKDAQIVQLKEELAKFKKMFGDNIALL